jgi:hypothetical protein
MRRGDHRVAFLAQTTGRLQMIVRCSYPASVELLLLRAHMINELTERAVKN